MSERLREWNGLKEGGEGFKNLFQLFKQSIWPFEIRQSQPLVGNDRNLIVIILYWLVMIGFWLLPIGIDLVSPDMSHVMVSPGIGRFMYRSPVGPVRIAYAGRYVLIQQTLTEESQYLIFWYTTWSGLKIAEILLPIGNTRLFLLTLFFHLFHIKIL